MIELGSERLGGQTVKLNEKVSIIGEASIAGKKEGQGPFKKYYDIILENYEWGESTWEKTEAKIQRETIIAAISKAKMDTNSIDCIFAGDLINQCTASSFGVRDLNRPFIGLYGACSTMAESLSLAAMALSSGFATNAVAITSSHFCTAERQFRMPLAYGGQRPPTAQWTVTGAGAMVLSLAQNAPHIKYITIGKIVDYGVRDSNDMGAAMAPAFVDTIKSHFEDTKLTPDYYDLILSGDLGSFGHSIAKEMLDIDCGYNLNDIYFDCGCLIYDLKTQDVNAGGSGCGCAALTLCSYIMHQIRKRLIKRVLFVGTGALMSPTTVLQGESIPGIAHAIAIEGCEETVDETKEGIR